MRTYRPRLVDQELHRALSISGAVHVRGPRACGKTSTAREQAQSEVRLDLSREDAALAREAPAVLLQGDTPRLIDEWQVVPELWNVVRHEVDDRQQSGQFILTGSARPNDDARRHPGAGRVSSIDMRTMALCERRESFGGIELTQLWDASDGLPTGARSDLLVPDYVDLILQGGWPGFQHLDPEGAAEANSAYIHEIVEHDFPEVGGRRRDPRLFRAYLVALAGTVAQPAQLGAVRRRMGEVLDRAPAPETVSHLHDFAHRLFLVEDQPAWAPMLRSRRALIQAPKRHVCDVGLVSALLGAGRGQLLSDLETLGFLFESLVVHDLRVLAQNARARGVFHYRDAKGRDEIDAVIEHRDGRWIGVEVKLSHEQVDHAASNLLRVSAQIARPPAALAVVVPTGTVHRRSDGVWVLPLSTLGPTLKVA